MPTELSRESLIAENERLLLECAKLRGENAQLKEALLAKSASESDYVIAKENTANPPVIPLETALEVRKETITKYSKPSKK